MAAMALSGTLCPLSRSCSVASMRIASPKREVLAPEHAPRVREVGDARQLLRAPASSWARSADPEGPGASGRTAPCARATTVRARCRSTWLRLEPSESSVGSPDALRNGRIASEIGAPTAAGGVEPPDHRPRSIHAAPASTITAAATMSQRAVFGRAAGAGTSIGTADVAVVWPITGIAVVRPS